MPEAEEREDLRELIFRSDRVIYLVEGDQVRSLTVIHGSQDLGGQAEKLWDVG